MNQDHIATPEEDEAFNMIEQQSNLGKQILADMKKQDLVDWHNPDCKGECFACLIEQTVVHEFGKQGLSFLQKHLVNRPSDTFENGVQEGMKIERDLWIMKIKQKKPLTKTKIGNHLRRHANGEFGLYRNGFKDGIAFAEDAHGIKEQS